MKTITGLTDQECLELYNANSGEELEAVDIERSPYGLLEIHHVGGYDDMMLTVSDKGALYLLCLDNNETYHDCLGALEWLKTIKFTRSLNPQHHYDNRTRNNCKGRKGISIPARQWNNTSKH